MSAPSVELTFNPTDLRPRDLPKIGEFLGTPSDAIEAALVAARLRMIEEMKTEVQGLAEPTHAQLLRAADLAWQAVFWRYRRISAPVLADAYIRAYRAAGVGDVPMSVIYDLADKHAEKIGDYFHSTSRDALAEGFNTLVNRRVPARAAVNQVLDAYGLTPRQMRGFTSHKQFGVPVQSTLTLDVKARARAYIDKSFITRTRKLARQEEHNIDQQAQQFAWMWMQDKGRLNKKAQKLWITAKDERVCPVCGPLHGQKVLVSEQFTTSHGQFWTPGLHPNCRCVVRLIENRFSKADDDWDPKEHPRGGDPKNRGRFSRVAEQQREPVIATSTIFDQLQAVPETQEEPRRVSLEDTSTKVSLGRGVSLGGKVSLGEKVSLVSDKVSLDRPSKASLEGEQKKVRLSPEEVRQRVAMAVTPQMRVAMDTRLAEMVRLDARRPATPRPLKTYTKATIKIQDENGQQYPVYAVVDPMDVDIFGDTMELNHDIEFSPNLDRITQDAHTRFEETMGAVYDQVIYNDDQEQVWEPTIGNRWHATLDDDTILNVIGWKAYQGRVLDSDWTGGDPTATVRWKSNFSNADHEREMHYSELAERLKLDDEDFNIKVIRLDEGHDSELGGTSQVTAGSRSGQEHWVTSGVYRAEQLPAERAEHGDLSLQIYHLEPVAEETERPSPFFD